MGNARKRKLSNRTSKPYDRIQPAKKNAPHSGTKKAKTKDNVPSSQPLPSLPFQATDKILLVGEGDFSFAASLVTHHFCSNMTATTFESQEVLLSKYPQASSNLATLDAHSQRVLFSIDAMKLGLPHAPGASMLRKSPGFDVVVFNFPHVGGKSTDVNRQVRANQELVVKFLEGAMRVAVAGATILLTVFEGQPYELWGVRNLARHVGLTVERSVRFDKRMFPGYAHARTLGNVDTGWKGEDREARMYILRKTREQKKTPKTRAKNESSSDDSS